MPTYKFKCVFTRNGAGVAPGSAPTVTIVDTSNTVLVNAASASSLSNLAGVYYYNYTGSAADCIAKFVTSDATVDEPEKYDYTPQVITDYIDASIAAVKAKTDNLPTDPADQSAVEAAITAAAAPLMTSAGYTAPDNAGITAIKAKTDNLPSDPADQSTLEAAITAATSPLMTSAGYTAPDNAGIAAIKAKTDNLPASPAATGDAMTLTAGTLTSIQSLILSDATPFPGARIDTAISTRSTLTAADVWANGTRTLSSFGTLVADIWAYATRTLSSYGTLVADIWSYSPRVVTVSANGTGSTSWPLTVTDTNGNPIVDVECWLTSDEPGNSLVVHGFTDTAGLVTFSVNPGTYYLWRRKNGWNFAAPTAVTIS